MPIQAENLGDLVKTTLNELGEMKFTEIATDLREHIAMRQLMKQNRVTFEAGPQIQWDIMTDHNDSAEFVGLYNSDNVNVKDVMIQGQIPWRHVTANWAIDEREVAMNRSPRKIVDLIKTRRIACLISMAEKFERAFWRVPAVDNSVDPYGVPYYVVKTNTAATLANENGFNGLVPSGYTTVANVNPTTYPRWANYGTQYTNVTKDDLIRKWRRAATMVNFKPPVDGIPTFNTGDKYGYYTNYAVEERIIEILESQNENLGMSVAPYEGMAVFKRVPIQSVPFLDNDTTNPVYGINWGEFKTAVLSGFWMKEVTITHQPGQHNVAATHVDCSFNWLTRNRRRHFVLATDTTMGY